nr:hypothetical protein Q903MT_gene3040 [Picea sitchensis]
MIDRGVLIHYIIIYEHTRGILGDVIEAYRVSFLSRWSSPLNASSPVGREFAASPSSACIFEILYFGWKVAPKLATNKPDKAKPSNLR